MSNIIISLFFVQVYLIGIAYPMINVGAEEQLLRRTESQVRFADDASVPRSSASIPGSESPPVRTRSPALAPPSAFATGPDLMHMYTPPEGGRSMRRTNSTYGSNRSLSQVKSVDELSNSMGGMGLGSRRGSAARSMSNLHSIGEHSSSTSSSSGGGEEFQSRPQSRSNSLEPHRQRGPFPTGQLNFLDPPVNEAGTSRLRSSQSAPKLDSKSRRQERKVSRSSTPGPSGHRPDLRVQSADAMLRSSAAQRRAARSDQQSINRQLKLNAKRAQTAMPGDPPALSMMGSQPQSPFTPAGHARRSASEDHSPLAAHHEDPLGAGSRPAGRVYTGNQRVEIGQGGQHVLRGTRSTDQHPPGPVGDGDQKEAERHLGPTRPRPLQRIDSTASMGPPPNRAGIKGSDTPAKGGGGTKGPKR